MVDSAVEKIAHGMHSDPFSFLGCHSEDSGSVVRAFAPNAQSLAIYRPRGKVPLAEMQPLGYGGVYSAKIAPSKISKGYRLGAQYATGLHFYEDPYRFPPTLGELDLHLLAEGRHRHAYRALGAHPMTIDGVAGVRFAVWAPNAASVCVAGDFNHWSMVKHPMRTRGSSGIWELFLPEAKEGEAYKYAIRTHNGHLLPLKADPFGFGAEMRPKSASVVRALDGYVWRDAKWLSRRAQLQQRDAPISVYELHLGSWQRGDDGRFLGYSEIAERLVPYVKELGFTHIELMPISEHPFDGSWGYQPIGLFAPTARFGEPKDFKAFVDACHQAEIGVILDWVPGHFPSDEHGLAEFDGSYLYEHADPKKGFHPDWNTLIFNFGRREVVNYLVSNARFWLEEYHIDGLRVDAVASMLYLDYSRKEGEWIPNPDGSNQNWEAVKFLQSMNADAYSAMPGVMTVAEESTAWPGVTARTDHDGLGFGYKWNMGWMNDTLEYLVEDPVHRKYHHHKMTFGIDYAFSENYILPLSHDEVVHGKGSLLARMPGDDWQRFANLRAYFGFMWGHPGKKLLFMGGEFAQPWEWQADEQLGWHLLDEQYHRGVWSLLKDLNAVYASHPELYQLDCEPQGFAWIDGGAQNDNVVAFLRRGTDAQSLMLVVCNFSPIPRHDYRVGVPFAGSYQEVLNTDSQHYGGSGKGNLGQVETDTIGSHGHANSLALTLPPLATVFLHHASGK